MSKDIIYYKSSILDTIHTGKYALKKAFIRLLKLLFDFNAINPSKPT